MDGRSVNDSIKFDTMDLLQTEDVQTAAGPLWVKYSAVVGVVTCSVAT